MDDYYVIFIYCLGVLLVTSVISVISYYQTKNKISENMETSKIQNHIKEDHNVECDGDKCVIIL
jgi:hypothetical protein